MVFGNYERIDEGIREVLVDKYLFISELCANE